MSKRKEIITIARGVIHKKGYHATSINDILQAATIGKGQFYHYFKSKYDLGLAVVEDIIEELDQTFIHGILLTAEEPKMRLNKMFDWTIQNFNEIANKSGCPIGNLAIELSEHEEEFRVKIQQYFERWIAAVESNLVEMVEKKQLDPTTDTIINAQAIVALIEGAILITKNEQDVQLLVNVINLTRKNLNLL